MSSECICFDNSFSSFSDTFPQLTKQTPLTHISTILSSLRELEEQFITHISSSNKNEINVLLRSFTTIITKCTEMKTALQLKSKEKETLNVSKLSTGITLACEAFDNFEQSTTPKFSLSHSDNEYINNKFTHLCVSAPQLIGNLNGMNTTFEYASYSCSCSSSNSSSMNSSIVMENITMKELLKTVKDMQDKGIITKKQKKFLKEKIISKEQTFYTTITSQYEASCLTNSNNSSNSSNELTRIIRTYLKQFKIM